jgi:hypothetical protein
VLPVFELVSNAHDIIVDGTLREWNQNRKIRCVNCVHMFVSPLNFHKRQPSSNMYLHSVLKQRATWSPDLRFIE